MHIVLSRTDSIGDVVLTLPMAGLIRLKYPAARISFIGRTYTEPVIRLSSYVDTFINWDAIEKQPEKERAAALKDLGADWLIHVFPNRDIARLAKKAGIRNRVGTSHRTYHWLTCNRQVNFSRKKSELHEAQLNCRLLEPLGIPLPRKTDVINAYGFHSSGQGTEKIKLLLDPCKKNIILHPKSKGSSREWGLDNFGKLIRILPADDFRIFVTGTSSEAEQMHGLLKVHDDRIFDVTGKLTLEEFITFIAMADGIVAASTGPLHLAAALGKTAIGIYPPIRPMHPGRWAPLGEKAVVLVKDIACGECRKTMDCHCIREIRPEEVKEMLYRI